MVLPARFAITNMSIPNLMGQLARKHIQGPLVLANLPSPSSVRWPAEIIWILFILQDMRLSLQRESKRLNGGRDEPNQDAELRRLNGELTKKNYIDTRL